MKIWPQSTIRELLAQASAFGEARAELPTAVDAERFRHAIYSFRRTRDIGHDLSVMRDNNIVIITKKYTPTITLLMPNDEEEERSYV